MREARMTLRRLTYLMLLVLVLSSQALAAETAGYEDMVAKFFDLVSTGKNAEAVDYLYKSNPYAEKIGDTIQQVKSSFASTQGVVGQYRGSSLILRKELGGRVAYL